MYVAARQVIRACSGVRNVGGVKCQPLSQAEFTLQMNTKCDLKWNHALWLLLNIQSSECSATTVAKICL